MPTLQRTRPPSQKTPESTPFPFRQLLILALCRICEPIAFMSIFPYIYYMIASFQITNDDKRIAFYAGMVTSAFALAEFSSGVLWGRLSDIIGRKPVLLCGLAGTGISMVAFGFAPNLPVALLARALGGLLNGSIIGSGLGGTLADPVRNYPTTFQPGSIFARFPYLLPNIVCAGVVVVSLVVGILFLEETHEDKKHRRDPGLACGRWILATLRNRWNAVPAQKSGYLEDTLSLLVEEDLLDYRSVEASPCITCSDAVNGEPPPEFLDDDHANSSNAATTGSFTPQILLNILSLGILAYHTICAEQLLPVLLAMEKSHEIPSLPFKFSGGFDLPAKSIGLLLSIQGFFQMTMQLFVFPIINRKLGSLRTFRLVAISYPFLYILVPYLTILPDKVRMMAIYPILLWKVTAQALSYPSNAIMLANAAPSKKVLGTLNGVAASAASLSRGLGPTLSGFIQAAGLGMGLVGLPWWVTSVIAAVGTVLSFAMTEVRGGKAKPVLKDHPTACEQRRDPSVAKTLRTETRACEEKESLY
ncbi:MAG: hypothetical protein M1821_002644 [Bathelium mastoideum]|nr:MAG: hypothetical protein M1821_002644 [Bathelium mastoideum]